MSKKILLLDCSKKLFARLKLQGFDVETGSLGYVTGIQKFQRPIYEYDILIYDPASLNKKIVSQYGQLFPKIGSPEYGISEILRHVQRGAVILTFINKVTDNVDYLNQVYGWIPDMPKIQNTKDFKITSGNISDWIRPVIIPAEVGRPVLSKLVPSFTTKSSYIYFIYGNNNNEILGVNYSVNKGKIIILPAYKSNDEITTIFLNRSIKKLFEDSKSNLIELFKSPDELKIEEDVNVSEETIRNLEHDLEKSNENLATATRIKEKTIAEDETSKLIINYYNLATGQDDSSIFYLYKIIDALKKKFGEKEAKNVLKCNHEFNLIGKLANRTYADARHAPYPGEKIKELTAAEIESCFTAAVKIINSYFGHLFSK